LKADQRRVILPRAQVVKKLAGAVGEEVGDLLDEAIGAVTSEPDGDDDVALSSAQPDHPPFLDRPAP